MCEYCSNTNRTSIIDRNGILGLTIWGKNNLCVYGKDEKGWDISEDKKINYCPMCGRKLTEE